MAGGGAGSLCCGTHIREVSSPIVGWNPTIGDQWRYQQSELNSWSVTFVPEYPGTKLTIVAMEGLKLIEYFTRNGVLPPGNKDQIIMTWILQ